MIIRNLHRSALTIAVMSVPVLLASGCAGTDFKLTAEEDGNASQSTAQAVANMENYMASLQTNDEESAAAVQHATDSENNAVMAPTDDVEPYATDADDITTTLATLEKNTVLASLTDTVIQSTTPNIAMASTLSDEQAPVPAENDMSDDEFEIGQASALPDEMPEDIVPVSRPQSQIFHFPFDKTELDAEDIETLRQHAQYLRHNPNLTIVIQGHTDNRGPAVYNQHLSEQRAQNVAELLLAEGIAESRIHWEGLGDALPMIDPGQWAENRRVELKYEDAYLVSRQQD